MECEDGAVVKGGEVSLELASQFEKAREEQSKRGCSVHCVVFIGYTRVTKPEVFPVETFAKSILSKICRKKKKYLIFNFDNESRFQFQPFYSDRKAVFDSLFVLLSHIIDNWLLSLCGTFPF